MANLQYVIDERPFGRGKAKFSVIQMTANALSSSGRGKSLLVGSL